MRACRANASLVSQASTRTTGRSLGGRVLVAGQLALSLLLLIGAGLFVGSMRNLRSIDLGFRPENVIVGQLSFGPGRVPNASLTPTNRSLEPLPRRAT